MTTQRGDDVSGECGEDAHVDCRLALTQAIHERNHLSTALAAAEAQAATMGEMLTALTQRADAQVAYIAKLERANEHLRFATRTVGE